MEPYFDHEKLHVYQQAVAFVAWSHDLLQRCKGRSAAKAHLDDASTSVVLNTAEGNGKYSRRDRRHYFEIARSSALECAGCLDCFVAKRMLTREDITPGKQKLRSIVNMLTGLMGSASDRVSEEESEYGGEWAEEGEKGEEEEGEGEEGEDQDYE